MRKRLELSKGQQTLIFLVVVIILIIFNNILNDFTKSFFVPNKSAFMIGFVIFLGYVVVMWNDEIGYFLQGLRR